MKVVMSMETFNFKDTVELLGGCPQDIFYFSPMPINLNGLFIQINRAGYVSETPRMFAIQRQSDYRFNVIHCVTKGKGTIIVRGKQHVISKGQLFVLAAQEPHAYATDPDDPLGLVWVEFGGGDSTAIMQHILDLGGPIFSGSVFNSITSLCTSLLYEPNQKNSKISAILYDMLMQLCGNLENNSIVSPINQEILRFIDNNIGVPVTLEMVAEHFGYNPSYFSARFSKITGIRFSQYVTIRRMNYACYMLLNTDWPIERISHELGFYDTSHFIQRFRTVEGITPARYRRQGVRVKGGELPGQLKDAFVLSSIANN